MPAIHELLEPAERGDIVVEDIAEQDINEGLGKDLEEGENQFLAFTNYILT